MRVLQAIGRTFEEDFNNFHDHEHWPGLALLGIRLALCAARRAGPAWSDPNQTHAVH